MKLTIEGSNFAAHMAPLSAAEKHYEGINCDKTAMTMQLVDGKVYLQAQTTQPQYDIFLNLCVKGRDEDSEDPTKAGLDPSAVAEEEGRLFVLQNSAFMNLLRTVGKEKADFTFTSDGLHVKASEDSCLSIDAEVETGSIGIPPLEEMQGIISNDSFLSGLKTPNAIAALGAKSGSLSEKAVHLSLSERGIMVEATSSTTLVQYADLKPVGSLAPGESAPALRHVAITPQAAKVLRQIIALSSRDVAWHLDEEGRTLTVCAAPYSIVIVTEPMDHCPLSFSEYDLTHLSVNRLEFWKAVNTVRKTRSKVTLLSIGSTGVLTVLTPDGGYECNVIGTYAGRMQSQVFSLPSDALLACLSGFEDTTVQLHYDEQGKSLVIKSQDCMVCEIESI